MSPVPGRVYKLDMQWIDRRCEELRFDRAELAFRIGLKDHLRSRVSGRLLKRILNVLDCRAEDCTLGSLVPGWRVMKEVRRRGTTPEDRKAERSDQDKLRLALLHDMNRDYDGAIRHGRALLKRIPAATEPELAARVRVHLINFLDNGGRLKESLAELDSLLHDLEARDLGEDGQEVRIWAELARGRLQHRLGDFAGAKETLERIHKAYGAPYDILAGHQLGVVALAEYFAMDPSDVSGRAVLLELAREYFEEAIRAWRKLAFCYHEGFSHRRLAQVHRLQHEYAQATQEYLDAIEAFASFDCPRYLKDARDELTDMLEERDDRLARVEARLAEYEPAAAEQTTQPQRTPNDVARPTAPRAKAPKTRKKNLQQSA